MGRFKRRTKTKTKTKSKRVLRNERIIKAPLYNRLFKDASLSLKRRKQFGDFINSFHSPQFFLENDDNWMQFLHARNGRIATLHVGDTILFTPISCRTKAYFDSILNRMIILFFTTLRKQDTKYELSSVIQSYAEDQFALDDRKVYPNEFVFIFLMGTIFASVGMALLLVCTVMFFSLGTALLYSILWTITLGIFWLKLKYGVNID